MGVINQQAAKKIADYQKPSAQAVISDLKTTNKLVMNIMYKGQLFKAMLDDYDEAGEKNKTFVIVHLGLSILEKVKEQFGRPMTPECLFATGMNILDKINRDITATGRKGLEEDDMKEASSEMMKEYIAKHSSELDMKDIGQKLLDLQKSIASGEFVSEVSKGTKVPEESLKSAINKQLNPQKQTGVLQK